MCRSYNRGRLRKLFVMKRCSPDFTLICSQLCKVIYIYEVKISSLLCCARKEHAIQYHIFIVYIELQLACTVRREIKSGTNSFCIIFTGNLQTFISLLLSEIYFFTTSSNKSATHARHFYAWKFPEQLF